jgi:hypothetical protein
MLWQCTAAHAQQGGKVNNRVAEKERVDAMAMYGSACITGR